MNTTAEVIQDVNEIIKEQDFNVLKALRNKIEKLTPEQHEEILKLLQNDAQLNFTENKSGTFVNLSDAQESTIETFNEFIIHLEVQEETLSNIEKQQEKCEMMLKSM